MTVSADPSPEPGELDGERGELWRAVNRALLTRHEPSRLDYVAEVIALVREAVAKEIRAGALPPSSSMNMSSFTPADTYNAGINDAAKIARGTR